MNILFLMADEFRHDAAGFSGHGLADTPCLDALAAGSAHFVNAHTPSPVCVPARQCLATGLYPEHANCRDFLDDLPPGAPTFARYFAEAGYYTVCSGKLHHRGPDQMQGWLHRIGSEQAVRWPSAFSDRMQIGRKKWRGAADLREAGVGVSPLALADDLATQGACDFLNMRFDGSDGLPPDLPLFLMVSLQQPHFPLLAPRDLFEKYMDRVVPFKDCGPANHPVLDHGRLGSDSGISDEDLRRATAAYAALAEQTDRRFARVIETLSASDQAMDEWLIVFCSDHGDMLGEHGLWGKRKFYEASVRVPLFLRGPGILPAIHRRNVNLVDLFPTLCDVAGLPIPEGLDGHSLFDSSAPDITFSQLGSDQFLIRSGPWKLMMFPNGGDVLFNVEEDPGEQINRIDDPECAEILKSLRAVAAPFAS